MLQSRRAFYEVKFSQLTLGRTPLGIERAVLDAVERARSEGLLLRVVLNAGDLRGGVAPEEAETVDVRHSPYPIEMADEAVIRHGSYEYLLKQRVSAIGEKHDMAYA